MSVFTKIINADRAELEVEIQTIAYNYGFAPAIRLIEKTQTCWYVTMDDLGKYSSLAYIYGDDPNNIPQEIWTQIRYMVQTLYEEEGIEYVDITPYNFIERTNRIYMIDYGDAYYTEPGANTKDWFLTEFLDDGVNNWNPDFA